mgnify:CR=1 FL=1
MSAPGHIESFQQLSEAAIIERILQGDLSLFEILIRRCNPFLYKIGRSYGFSH